MHVLILLKWSNPDIQGTQFIGVQKKKQMSDMFF